MIDDTVTAEQIWMYSCPKCHESDYIYDSDFERNIQEVKCDYCGHVFDIFKGWEK